MSRTDKIRAVTDTSTIPRFIEVGILAYRGSQIAAIYGLKDMFEVASRLATQHDGAEVPSFRISHWRWDEESNCCKRILDTHPEQPAATLKVLILPPSLAFTPTELPFRLYVEWIKTQHHSGAIICSVCAAAFLLAETGLLDRRSATTHWMHTSAIAKRFPLVQWDTSKLLIDDSDILTAGGVMAWVDLGLNLIGRFLGSSTMLATARYFLVDAAGREQRFYALFQPRFDHGDEAILKVQHRLQHSYAKNLSIAEMASEAKLGERTFLRRFLSATETRPTEYVQLLRINKAREELELTQVTIQEIAWKVGYCDASSFRRAFQRIIGLSPGEYRRRFHSMIESA